MIEIWRDIKDYEGLYQVSNFGKVKRLAGKGCRQERILNPFKDKKGYLHVQLYKNGKTKGYSIHRLVAEAFIDNPDSLPCVNHKDENPSNNRVENLEWCTYEYNNNYGTVKERIAKTMTNGKLSKVVYQFTLDGTFVREWPSTAEVQRQTGWNSQNISACCLGKRNHVGGYVWRYAIAS